MRRTRTYRQVMAWLYKAHSTGQKTYGYEIMKGLSMKSGTLYPLLDRMVIEGLLTYEREGVDPFRLGRPERVYYRLTPAGVAAAMEVEE